MIYKLKYATIVNERTIGNNVMRVKWMQCTECSLQHSKSPFKKRVHADFGKHGKKQLWKIN